MAKRRTKAPPKKPQVVTRNMPCYIDRLPAELLSPILASTRPHVQVHDFVNPEPDGPLSDRSWTHFAALARVCSIWQDIHRPLLFHRVIVDGKREADVSAQLGALRAYRNLGRNVRVLVLRGTPFKNSVTPMLNSCPRLTSIICDRSSNRIVEDFGNSIRAATVWERNGLWAPVADIEAFEAPYGRAHGSFYMSVPQHETLVAILKAMPKLHRLALSNSSFNPKYSFVPPNLRSLSLRDVRFDSWHDLSNVINSQTTLCALELEDISAWDAPQDGDAANLVMAICSCEATLRQLRMDAVGVMVGKEELQTKLRGLHFLDVVVFNNLAIKEH